jgi:RNA polymerase sigma-70 factor (ECF subfamily)
MDRFPTPPDERETLDLLGRIRAGEDQAWSDLYARYRDEMLFTIRANLGARLRGALQSEDVLQSVALEAFLAVPRFEDRGAGSLRAFLNRLLIHKIRDRARHFGAAKRRGAVPLSEAMAEDVARDDAAAPAYHDERYAELERGLSRLPDEMREVVVLRKIDGLSSKEAAERLGKSDAATRKLFSRAMAKLSLWMEAPEEDGVGDA